MARHGSIPALTRLLGSAAMLPCLALAQLDEDVAALLEAAKRIRSASVQMSDREWNVMLDRVDEVTARWLAATPAPREGAAGRRLFDVLNLLSQRSVVRQQTGHAIAASAARLLATYRALDDAGVAASRTTLYCRAQLALAADDFELARQVLARPQPEATTALDRIRASALRILTGRLECELGRLERASEHLYASLATSVQLVHELRDDESAVRTLAEQSRRNALLAVADLHLLDGDFQGGLDALAALPADDSVASWYRLIFGTVGRDPDAEQQLAAQLPGALMHPRLRGMAIAKLIQRAMERGDFETAATRLQQLRPARDVVLADREHRFDLIELELFLGGGLGDPAEVRERSERAFAALLSRWRASPRPRGGIGFLQQDDRSTWLSAMVRLAFADGADAGARERALELVLRAHAAAVRADAACTTAELRDALLPPGAGLLVYLPGRLRSVVLVVERDDVALVELAPAVRLRAHIDALGAALADRLAGFGADRWRARADAAADDLLPPAVRARVARCRQLTICGAGLLQNAPFDLLPIGRGERALLGLQAPICYAANLLEQIARPSRARADSVCLAAALRTTRAGVARQTVGAAAVQALLAPYASDHRAVLLDDEVTTARLQQSLPEAAVVHLIAHGVDDPGRAHPNGVAFADDLATHGLFYDQVEHLELDGCTVIVGACNAGEAPWRRGDEPLEATLAGGLLRAGARCVLVPTTAIRFGAHVDAMAIVHERMAGGATPAAALLAARQAAQGAAMLELLLTQVHGDGF